MNPQSMAGYFEHTKNKTYIDKYPRAVINLSDLRDSIIVEFGSGAGNDIAYLIEHSGLNPCNLFLIDSDIYPFIDAMDRLEKLFGKHYDSQHFNWKGVLENGFPDEFAEFVYANNFLHCLGYRTLKEEGAVNINAVLERLGPQPPRHIKELYCKANLEPEDKARKAVGEAYRILKPNGVFFGRTLSDHIDLERLRNIEDRQKKSEQGEFVIATARALERKELIGLSPRALEAYAKEHGFQRAYTESTPESWSPVRDFYFRLEK